jgi:hypothetical protein
MPEIKWIKSSSCAFCLDRPMFDGCSVNLVSITESGQVIDSMSNTEGSMSVMLPTCPYHTVLVQGGIIAVTTNNMVIQSKILTELESLDDNKLRELRLKLSRAQRTELNRAYNGVAKILLDARKFREEMNKVKGDNDGK